MLSTIFLISAGVPRPSSLAPTMTVISLRLRTPTAAMMQQVSGQTERVVFPSGCDAKQHSNAPRAHAAHAASSHARTVAVCVEQLKHEAGALLRIREVVGQHDEHLLQRGLAILVGIARVIQPARRRTALVRTADRTSPDDATAHTSPRSGIRCLGAWNHLQPPPPAAER
jgi:hypothetical protein